MEATNTKSVSIRKEMIKLHLYTVDNIRQKELQYHKLWMNNREKEQI